MPTYTKMILCLANSRKTAGRCIAGREIANGNIGPWIRPVSDRENAEISEEDRRFENGEDPRVLDVIKVPLLKQSPHQFQIENHLINPDYYWSLKKRATYDEALLAVDGGQGTLWNNQHSTYNGQCDKVEVDAVVPNEGSLRLIEVQDLVVQVGLEGGIYAPAKRKVRGRFTHVGVQYCLSITDPLVEREFLARGNGAHQIDEALLCISLSEPFHGWVFKLIAAVIRR